MLYKKFLLSISDMPIQLRNVNYFSAHLGSVGSGQSHAVPSCSSRRLPIDQF